MLYAISGLGLEAHELDLRNYQRSGTGLERDLAGCAAAWVGGGNAFTLRHAMKASGADALIPRLIADDAFVYAGCSAGPASWHRASAAWSSATTPTRS